MSAFTTFTSIVFTGMAVCLLAAITPAIAIWSFNTLNEQGQWGLSYMPHNLWTYLATIVVVACIKVRIKR